MQRTDLCALFHLITKLIILQDMAKTVTSPSDLIAAVKIASTEVARHGWRVSGAMSGAVPWHKDSPLQER